MIIFKKMFAEKILRFHEAMNRFSELLMRMPHLGDKIRNQIEENDNYRLKMTFGVIAQIGIVLFELLRKFLYVGFFVYLPYRIIAHFCPLIASHRELTMVFLFFMLSTICGSLANTTLMSMGDRDYLMIRIMLISPYMNFLGKIVYKIATDLVYFTIILTIFGISFGHSLALSIVTASLRPVGEMIAIIMFDKIKAILADELQISGDITEQSELAELGINSLELADLVMRCENDFGIEIKDEDIRTFITVGDLVHYVDGLTSN